MNRSAAHTALVRDALVALSRAGVMCWEHRTGVGRALSTDRVFHYGLKGSSDIIGIIPPNGRTLVAEAKTGSAVAKEQQKKFGRAAADRGAVWVIFHDVDELLLAVEHAKSSAAEMIMIPLARGAVA